MKHCVIFCGGEFDRLHTPIPADSFLIAADRGLEHIQKLNLSPDLVIGDFDSLGYQPQGAAVFPVEKDDTDSMLAVRRGLEAGCTDFLLYGALDGSRVDHTMANFQLLAFLAEHGARGTLLGLRQCATLVKDGCITFPGEYEGIFSVFCLGADAKGVTIRGGQYEVEKVTLTAAFPLGVSNHFVGKSVEVSAQQGQLLVIYDRQKG